MADPESTHELQPGDVGVIIRANGTVDLLVPGGEENKPLGSIGRALAGACVLILSDPDTQAVLEERFVQHMSILAANKAGVPPKGTPVTAQIQ